MSSDSKPSECCFCPRASHSAHVDVEHPPDPDPELYEFVGSCWSNAPKLAIPETGYKDGDIEFISINLAEVSALSSADR